jgi:hypothetical protein
MVGPGFRHAWKRARTSLPCIGPKGRGAVRGCAVAEPPDTVCSYDKATGGCLVAASVDGLRTFPGKSFDALSLAALLARRVARVNADQVRREVAVTATAERASDGQSGFATFIVLGHARQHGADQQGNGACEDRGDRLRELPAVGGVAPGLWREWDWD